MGPQAPRRVDLKPGTTVPSWVRLLPAAALAATAAFQLTVPDPAVVGFTSAVVPLVAAFVAGPVWIASIAVVVMVLLATPVLQTDHFTTVDFFAIGVVWATGIGLAWARRRFQARMVTVASVAEAAQYAVLPTLPDRVGELACAGLYHSAQQDARIGGDLFDIRTSPFGTRMILGDVQGHGLPAVSTAAALLASFHEAILDEPDLEHIAARLERRILVDADQGYIPELFASVLLVEFCEDTEAMRLLSCGHPPPLILRPERVEEIGLDPRPVLGLRLEAHSDVPDAETVPFRSDEMLLAYSDGVSEARDANGRCYPLTEHLNGLVMPHSPAKLVDFVWSDLTRFAAKLDDDMSLLAVTRGDRGGRAPD